MRVRGEFLRIRDEAGNLVAYIEDDGNTTVSLADAVADMVRLTWGVTLAEMETNTEAFGLVPCVHCTDIGVIRINASGAIRTWEL